MRPWSSRWIVTRYPLTHLTGEKTDDDRAANSTGFRSADRARPTCTTERAGGPADTSAPASPAGAWRRAAFQVGEAFNYGWKKFQEYLGPILIAMLIFIVVGGAVNFIATLLGGGFGELTDTDDIGIGMFFGVGYLFFSLLSALVSLLIQAAVVRGALKITEGQRIELSTFLSTEHLGQVVLASILLGHRHRHRPDPVHRSRADPDLLLHVHLSVHPRQGAPGIRRDQGQLRPGQSRISARWSGFSSPRSWPSSSAPSSVGSG